MKASRYNHFFPVGNGRTVAYNARTGSFLSLTDECYETIQREGAAWPDQVNLPMRALLTEFGFIVPDQMDELLLLRHQMMEARYDKTALGLTVAPTLACNLRCVYCYEQGVCNEGHMSTEVEKALIDYIDANTPRSGSLSIAWYGGEPLLCSELICRVSQTARRLADERNARFGLSMITNGTLLTQEILDTLSTLGAGTIQITLDGSKDVHDPRKPFAGGVGSSFDAIMANVCGLDFHQFRVSIRCNIDRTNESSTYGLLDELKRRNAKVSVYPAAVRDLNGVACKTADGICYAEEEFVSVSSRFQRVARDMGFGQGRRPTPRKHYCGADRANSRVVGPDGSLYRCWNHIGCPEFVVGHLLYATMCPSDLMDWTLSDPTRAEPCSSCDILPLCLGGCPEKRRLKPQGEHAICDQWRFDLKEVLRDWAEDWDRQVNKS